MLHNINMLIDTAEADALIHTVGRTVVSLAEDHLDGATQGAYNLPAKYYRLRVVLNNLIGALANEAPAAVASASRYLATSADLVNEAEDILADDRPLKNPANLRVI